MHVATGALIQSWTKAVDATRESWNTTSERVVSLSSRWLNQRQSLRYVLLFACGYLLTRPVDLPHRSATPNPDFLFTVSLSRSFFFFHL